MNRSYQYIQQSFRKKLVRNGKDSSSFTVINGVTSMRIQSFSKEESGREKGKKFQKGNKKENFAKKFLDPAARGELSKHQSGIPKLAARKSKGHSLKDEFPPGSATEDLLAQTRKMFVESKGDITSDLEKSIQDNVEKPGKHSVKQFSKGWNLESAFEPVKAEILDPTKANGHVKWLGNEEPSQQNRFQQQRNLKQNQRRDQRNKVFDIWGDEELQSEIDDPWPTDTAHFTYHVPHAESRREAKPIFHPTNRVNPPEDFVSAHEAFAYVTNVPRPVMDGELSSYENPLHRHEVVEFVANLFGISATHVFPATITSAFVGFESAKEAAEAYKKSESKRVVRVHTEAKRYENDAPSKDEKNFVGTGKDSIIMLENIPSGMRQGTVARFLHSAVSLNVDDVFMSSPTTALIRLPSPEEAARVLGDKNMHDAILSLQNQIVRIYPAQREVVHDKYSGPIRQFQLKKTTNKLVVHGDTPSKDFFLSHASVLHLCNVPVSVTKKQISDYFQKYCVQPRDVEGSIEIVTSLDGYPSGRVYVGFDLESEYKSAWQEIFSSGQKVLFNESGPPVRIRPVKERALIRGSKLGARSERSQEELIASFSEWKNVIDPADKEFLDSMGVTMDVLEEAFTAARRYNPTFGVEDQAREGERMLMEKSPGQHFQEFVKLYIDTLKEAAFSRENPGLKYKSMFMPDEEIDYSFITDEEERLSEINEKYRS
jgi:hypothetical protein